MSRPACRIGDADIPHCSGMVRAQGVESVLVNGRPWSCLGHMNTPHLLPGDPCPVHSAPIATASTSVFVGRRAAGRIGDKIGGCTAVAQGSLNVFCGG